MKVGIDYNIFYVLVIFYFIIGVILLLVILKFYDNTRMNRKDQAYLDYKISIEKLKNERMKNK